MWGAGVVFETDEPYAPTRVRQLSSYAIESIATSDTHVAMLGSCFHLQQQQGGDGCARLSVCLCGVFKCTDVQNATVFVGIATAGKRREGVSRGRVLFTWGAVGVHTNWRAHTL